MHVTKTFLKEMTMIYSLKYNIYRGEQALGFSFSIPNA